MTRPPLPLIERRKIEAELLGPLYETLRRTQGQTQALETIRAAIQPLARIAGARFAANAPEGPSLRHFATVLDLWAQNQAIGIQDARLEGDTLTFRVTACKYAELYSAMGLPPELAAAISCERDLPFAQGYSPSLRMERPDTLLAGRPACLFRFVWTEPAES
jgi:hypothetical protein